MSKNTDRRQGEGYQHPEKETGRTGDNQATQNSNIDTPDSTAPEAERERGLFLPLAWAQLGGKPSRENRKLKRAWKRKAGGAISAELLGLLVLGAVVALLLSGGA